MSGGSACARRVSVLAVALLSLSVVAGCTAGAPEDELTQSADGDPSYPTDEPPMSSLALINDAMTEGRLDYSTGLLYKVYAMFEPESLPPEFQSDVPSKCGTPIILEVQRNWNMLTPSDRAEISRYVQPIGEPGDTGTQLDDVTKDSLDDERRSLD